MPKKNLPDILPLKCPKCKITARGSDKFCPSCGRRIGFGVRSEGEIRAAVHRLDASTFTVSDPHLKAMIMSDIVIYKDVLSWFLGEKDEDPLDMIIHDIKEHGKVRINGGG